MNIRNTLDRIKHTRISKSEESEHEKKSHDEMQKKYEQKKKFHSSHNQDRPKEETAKQKVLKSVMSHGKKFVESSRKRAQEQALNQKQKKSKKPSTGTRQGNAPRPEPFNFGFGQSDIPLDEMFDFRNKRDHSKLFKKRKSDVLDNVWNPKDFWN